MAAGMAKYVRRDALLRMSRDAPLPRVCWRASRAGTARAVATQGCAACAGEHRAGGIRRETRAAIRAARAQSPCATACNVPFGPCPRNGHGPRRQARRHVDEDQSGSETRRPVRTASKMSAWSRRPDQQVRSGAASSASISMRVREADELAAAAFARHRQHALDDRTVARLLQRGVAEERVDGRQARIATARRVAAPLLKVIEEGANDAWIEVLQSERGRLLLEALPSEAEQQPKRVAVGSNRVGARLTLTDQTVSEEGFEQAGEVGRGASVLDALPAEDRAWPGPCASTPARRTGTSRCRSRARGRDRSRAAAAAARRRRPHGTRRGGRARRVGAEDREDVAPCDRTGFADRPGATT